MAKILLVDDEPRIEKLVRDMVEGAGYEFAYAENGADALALVGRIAPDLVIMDVMMPKMDGFTACRELRARGVTVPVIFLSAKGDIVDKGVGFAAGGDDYMVKPFDPRELMMHIEAHLRREARGRQTSEVVAAQGLLINRSQRKVFAGDREIAFSKREFDILDFLASHPNQVFDRERIYAAVWGIDGQGDASVVKEHVRKIRQKLSEACGSEPIETVWGMGYRWKA